MLLVVGCDGTPPLGRAPAREMVVQVVDEAGAPVRGASMTLVGRAEPFVVRGTTTIALDQPTAGVIGAAGFLDEPVVLDPGEHTVTVQLLARVGPSGQVRRAFQFGGDVMLGRRYEAPTTGADTPVVTDAATARDVVSSVAPLMSIADASMVNLETVVGNLSMLDAYPGKRFLLQSPPLVLDVLTALGIDVANLGNNHSYDWRQEGVASTVAQLDQAGFAHVGAGTSAAQAQAGLMISVAGMKVGVVSGTTVNGDFVNDSLPTETEPQPAAIATKDAWQYSTRAFRFGHLGDANYVAPANRRAGAVWALFQQLDATLSSDQSAALWAAVVDTYPEMQDWVARRGHGGAALLDPNVVAQQVHELRAEGAQLVIVQIHGGFQFSAVPSSFIRDAAHAAIDAGADLVVGHHPHVLQGIEWYKGHLIAYSLGNFVFDQDFLETFPSVILRTVFEGDHLLQARVIPLVIDHYRPVPVTGEVARRVLRTINESSMLAASSDRLPTTLVTSVLDQRVPLDALVQPDGGTARIVDNPVTVTDTYSLKAGRVTALPACAVVHALRGTAAPSTAMVGRDLLGWGSLDDGTADGVNDGGLQWRGDGSTRYSPEHGSYLHLESTAHASASARQVARSDLPLHRWSDTVGNGLDGDARYTVQLDVRSAGTAPVLRLSLYDVNDTDPTVEPTSTLLHTAQLALPTTTDGQWRTVTVDITDVVDTVYGGVRPEAVLVYVVAPAGDSRPDIDNVRLFEWRSLASLPEDVWTAADAITATTDGDVSLAVRGCDG